MSESSIHITIADKVFEAEKRDAAALGHDRMDVALLAFGAFCEVWSLSIAEDRPAVNLPLRMIGNMVS